MIAAFAFGVIVGAVLMVIIGLFVAPHDPWQ